MPQISLTSSDDDDKSYEWKKLKKACKKVKSIAGWMLSKSSTSAEDYKVFRKDLFAICEIKQQVSSSKASPSAQKGSFREVLLLDKDHHRLYKELCDMEKPLVDNGNMKCSTKPS